MKSESIEEVINLFRSYYEFSPEIEITLEANPETLTPQGLDAIRASGVNRLSIGIQSFQSPHLRRLERLSTAEAIEKIIPEVQCRFENFSLDLMMGIPDQTAESFETDLQRILEIEPPHVSIYILTLKENHVWKTHRSMAHRLGTSEFVERIYLRLCQALAEKSYQHYEVSNFAKLGFQSRHNSNYWNVDSSYLGLGPGAHGYLKQNSGEKFRYENISDIKGWSEHSEGVDEFAVEKLTPAQSQMEELYLFLRTRRPIAIDRLDPRSIDALLKEQKVEVTANTLTLSEPGWLLLESIAERLIP